MRKNILFFSFLALAAHGAGQIERTQPAEPGPQPSFAEPDSVQAFQLEAKDPQKAQALYERGCRKGEAASCSGSARLLARSGKAAQAKPLYERACALGDGYGCYQLAQTALPKEKKELWRKSCESGIGYACFLWGTEERNQGLNPEKAFEKGCQRADLHSCNGLGLLAHARQDLAKAKQLFEAVCAKKAALGCNNLGLVELELGNATRAGKLFETACREENDYHACNSLGVLAKRSGNPEKASRMYRLACEHGVSAACRNLGP